ncbi:MAG: P-type conjugative transfer protein TrbL, partial [Gemmatimonadaceae bacterium]
MKNKQHCLALLCLLASAPAMAGPFSAVQDQIKHQTESWFNGLFTIADHIFMLLVGIEIVWMASMWVLNGRDATFIFPALAKKVVTIGFFLVLLLNAGPLSSNTGGFDHHWFHDLVHGGIIAAMDAGGQQVEITPDMLLGDGVDQAVKLVMAPIDGMSKASHTTPPQPHSGGRDSPGPSSGGGVLSFLGLDKLAAGVSVILMETLLIPMAMVIFAAFFLMAIRLFMSLVESYIVLSAGVIFLGLGGSRWTARYVQNYINYSVSITIKLFMTYLILGAVAGNGGILSILSQNLTQTIASIAENSTAPSQGFLSALGGIMAAYLAIAILVFMAPKFAASLASGQSTAGAGDLMAPLATAAAITAPAALLAGAGATSAAGAAGKALSGMGGSVGGGSGVMSVADAAKMGDGAGSGGFGGSVSGGSGPAGGTPPGSGSGNGTGTAPGIAPASLSPEAIKSQLQNFTPNPIGRNTQGAGVPTKPAASPSSPGN